MNRLSVSVLVLVLVTGMLLGGCASQQSTTEQAQQYDEPNDPLESLNRTMWDFNYEILDEYILRTHYRGLCRLYAATSAHWLTEYGGKPRRALEQS